MHNFPHNFAFSYSNVEGSHTQVAFTAPEGAEFDEIAQRFLQFLSVVYGYEITMGDLVDAVFPKQVVTFPEVSLDDYLVTTWGAQCDEEDFPALHPTDADGF